MEKSNINKNSFDSIEKIKQILLTDAQNRITELENELENLRKQLVDKEYLIESINPFIVSLLAKKNIESKDEMAEAFAPVIGEALKKQIEDTKEDIVDALYPVIGSTIRKSITEAMKNLVKTVNEKLDRTFSLVRLNKKIRSKISGVSVAELLIQESIPFKIYEIFYIHRETGILISHASGKSKDIHVDKDLISGMLTAIRNFASTILDKNEDQNIHEIQYDDFQIQLEVGRYGYLAAVVSGLKNEEFNERLKETEQKLHQFFFKQMRDFEGDVSKFQDAAPILKNIITYTVRKDPSEIQPEKSKSRIILAFTIFIIILLYLAIFYFPQKTIENNISTKIESLGNEFPDLINGQIQYKLEGRYVELTGLADSWRTKKEIERRITNLLQVESVTNKIQLNNELASAEIVEKIKKGNLDFSKSLIRTLSKLKYIYQDEQLFIEGRVKSISEKVLLGHAIATISNSPIIVNNVIVDENIFNESEYLISKIEEMTIRFLIGQKSPPNDELKKIRELSNWLKEISFTKLYLCGHADDLGDEQINLNISHQRSEEIKNLLIKYGIESTKLIVEYVGASLPLVSNKTEEGRSLNRRVTFLFHSTN